MTTLTSDPQIAEARYDPAALIAAAESCGLIEASDAHLEEGWAIAGRLISPDISPLSEYRRIAAHSGICVVVYLEDGRITGMYALLLFNRLGLDALKNQVFDAIRPDLKHLATPNDGVCAHYGWGIAATSKAAARATFTAMDAINRVSFDDLPYYVRAATEDGRRVILKSGCVPVPWGDPDLFWSGGSARELRERT